MDDLKQTVDAIRECLQSEIDKDSVIKENLADICSGSIECAYHKLEEVVYRLRKIFYDNFYDVLKIFGNKRTGHLASHAKKERVRKKNLNRFYRNYLKFCKKVTDEDVKGNT